MDSNQAKRNLYISNLMVRPSSRLVSLYVTVEVKGKPVLHFAEFTILDLIEVLQKRVPSTVPESQIKLAAELLIADLAEPAVVKEYIGDVSAMLPLQGAVQLMFSTFGRECTEEEKREYLQDKAKGEFAMTTFRRPGKKKKLQR